MHEDGVIAVAVVEDQPLFRVLLEGLIAEAPGLRLAFSAPGVQEARRRMPEASPDVALLDIELPDGNGFELGRELRRRHPDLGVVLLSSHDMMETLLELPAEERSGWSYLSKTSATSHDDLLRAVRTSASGGSLLDPALVERRIPRRGSPLSALTPRQLTAAKLVAAGLANDAIAREMGISVHSVDNLLNVVYASLGVREHPEVNPRVATALTVVQHAVPGQRR
jgi:DNA-binding NarL/FixJ family response regulator